MLKIKKGKLTMADTRWFNNDRFGMFIHWGLYSTQGGMWEGKKIKHDYSEWLQASVPVRRDEYRKLAETFNPSDFCADDWIREASNAGMRYFLITAKHHDGFCLWPTKVSDYNVMDATPFKRDILEELASACKKYNVRLGFYYSHWMDWDGSGGDVFYPSDSLTQNKKVNETYNHPTQEEFEKYWQGKCLPQVQELIENYNPSFFWFDSWNEFASNYITPERQDELIEHIRKHDPTCLINSRINFTDPSDKCDYLSMMDNCYPDTSFDKPWETSGTLNHSWAYHKLDFQWKSTEELLKYLIGNASLGGNYQLNVGPMADGLFQKAAIKRLREIGCWIDVNSESIYGTSASTLAPMPWGKITTRPAPDATIYYLHLWDYTPETAIEVAGITGSVESAKILENGQAIRTQVSENSIYVSIPKEVSGLSLPVIAVKVLKSM
jgi:alpha-L-fucosidase